MKTKVVRTHTETGEFIDKISLPKATQILVPFYSFTNSLESKTRIEIKNCLENGRKMNSKLYSYQIEK
jgi:hypothetical protein